MDKRLKHTNYLSFYNLADVSFFSVKLDITIKRTVPVKKISLTEVPTSVGKPTSFLM